jgi:hypothetical protein
MSVLLLRALSCFLAISFWLVGAAPNSQILPASQTRSNSPQKDATAISARMQEIAVAGKPSDLRGSNFTDYRQLVQGVCRVLNRAPLWLRAVSLSTSKNSYPQKGRAL